MSITVTVRNPLGPHKLLTRVARDAPAAATEAAAEYLIGNDQRGLRHLAPHKYVSRLKAYGQSFFSDKQRRYVMAMIRSGRITPGVSNRTGRLSAGWKMEGRGLVIKVFNREPSAIHVQSDASQARQPAMVGHRRVSAVTASNFAGMIRAAQQAVNRVLKGRR